MDPLDCPTARVEVGDIILPIGILLIYSTAYFPLDYVGLPFFHPSLAVPWEQVFRSWVRWTPRYFISVNVTVSVFDTCFLILSVCCECWKYKRFLFPFLPVHLSEPPGRTGHSGSHGAWGVELARVSQALSAGHHLVYSLCTFLSLVSLQTFPSGSFVLMFFVY